MRTILLFMSVSFFYLHSVKRKSAMKTTIASVIILEALLTRIFREASISVADIMQKVSSRDAGQPLTTAVFHILLALADEERHGYGTMQDVAKQTNNALRLGPGTLYGCIK